jgi:hypothetical protein
LRENQEKCDGGSGDRFALFGLTSGPALEQALVLARVFLDDTLLF